MLKRLTGKNVKNHRALNGRKAEIPLCYYECQFPCEVEPGGERYVLMAVEAIK